MPPLIQKNRESERNFQQELPNQMYVFVDSLVTRMAENHSSRDAH